MSEPEQEHAPPSVGQSEWDLLAEIRDLLTQILEALRAAARG